jgi:hypothetical protein
MLIHDDNRDGERYYVKPDDVYDQNDEKVNKNIVIIISSSNSSDGRSDGMLSDIAVHH